MFKTQINFWKAHKHAMMAFTMILLALGTIFLLKALRHSTIFNIIIAFALLLMASATLAEVIWANKKKDEIEEFEVVYTIGKNQVEKQGKV